MVTAGRGGGAEGKGCRGPEMICPGRGGAVGAGFAGMAMVRWGMAGAGGGVAGAGAGGGAIGASLGTGAEVMGPASGGRNGMAGRGADTACPIPGFSASASAAGGGGATTAAAADSTGAAARRSGSSSLSCVSSINSSSATPADTAIPKSCSLPVASPPSCPSICRILRATSSSIELECVFFSDTPNSGRRSMIRCGLTSNSRASSLIRILLICRLCELLSVTVLPIARIEGTARG